MSLDSALESLEAQPALQSGQLDQSHQIRMGTAIMILTTSPRKPVWPSSCEIGFLYGAISIAAASLCGITLRADTVSSCSKSKVIRGKYPGSRSPSEDTGARSDETNWSPSTGSDVYSVQMMLNPCYHELRMRPLV